MGEAYKKTIDTDLEKGYIKSLKMLKCAGFNLTKWVSNVKEVIERIPESERAPSIRVLLRVVQMPERAG